MEFSYFMIVGIIFVLLIVGVAVVLLTRKSEANDLESDGKYPKGHYMSIGIAIGIPLGIPMGLILGNIALGPAIGAGIGVSIGAALEEKYKDNLRPLTEEEEERKKKVVLLLLALFVLGLVAFLAFMFM